MKRQNNIFCFCFMFGAFLSSTAGTHAAQIAVETVGPVSSIRISGVLEDADVAIFERETTPLSRASIKLDSPGGALIAGIKIGEIIRERRFATIVSGNSICNSACTLVWIGGADRWLGRRSHLGFHAAYEIAEGVSQVSAAGNALVGAYLGRMGVPDRAIVTFVDAPPSSISMMNADQIRSLGLTVFVVHESEKLPKSGAQAPFRRNDR